MFLSGQQLSPLCSTLSLYLILYNSFPESISMMEWFIKEAVYLFDLFFLIRILIVFLSINALFSKEKDSLLLSLKLSRQETE